MAGTDGSAAQGEGGNQALGLKILVLLLAALRQIVKA
jgi:hypothetical protein